MLGDVHDVFRDQLAVSGGKISTNESVQSNQNEVQRMVRKCHRERHSETACHCPAFYRKRFTDRRCVCYGAAFGDKVAEEAPELEGGERKALEERIGWGLTHNGVDSAYLLLSDNQHPSPSIAVPTCAILKALTVLAAGVQQQ